MHFRTLPRTIHKRMEIRESGSIRTISFEAPLDTTSNSWNYDPSALQDGRAIGCLRCGTAIRVAEETDASSFVTFIPTYRIDDLRIKEPDALALELRFPVDAFDELWRAVCDGQRIIIGGHVDGLPRQHPAIPTPSAYVWDVSQENNRTKAVSYVWFTILHSSAQPADTELMLKSVNSDEMVTPRRYAESARTRLQEQFERSTQMYRVCDRVIEQAEQEATRVKLTGWEAESLINDVVSLVESLHAGVRSYDAKDQPGELWTHKDVARLYAQGRPALGQWSVDQDELASVARGLIERPWLRVDALELAIVDALTFKEVFEFGEALKSNFGPFSQAWAYAKAEGNLQKMSWERIKAAGTLWLLRWGLVAVGVWLMWSYLDAHDFHGLPAFVILAATLLLLPWFFVGVPVGRKEKGRATQQRMELLLSMRDAYATMRSSGLLSPNQIRASLLYAQEKGAVWNATSLALLDRAAMRDPPVWI